jgi:hypothetical protein
MDASKVTLSPGMTKYNPLDNAKKRQLREEKIKELIQSKPYGTAIGFREFGKAIGTSAPTAYHMVSDMLRQGTLARDQISRHPARFSYTVNGTVKTTKLAPPPSSKASRREAASGRQTQWLQYVLTFATRQGILLADYQQRLARLCRMAQQTGRA